MRLGAHPTFSEGQDFNPGGSSPLWILANMAFPWVDIPPQGAFNRLGAEEA